MERLIDRACPLQRNLVRQVSVRAAHPGALRPNRLGIEMNHLTGGMYAGIGPPRRGDPDRLRSDRGECCLKAVLDGVARRLRLPACERRAIVGHADGDPQFPPSKTKKAADAALGALPRSEPAISAFRASVSPAAAARRRPP